MAERNSATLETLVLEGTQTTERDAIVICATLGLLSKLSTLKLRRMGLTDHALGMIVSVLIQKVPPLTRLDLSCNDIQAGGSFALMGILSNQQIARSLTSLNLSNNQLDRTSISQLLTTAACRLTPDFELRFDNNGNGTGLLAYEFAVMSAAAEADRDKVARELSRVKSQLKEAQYHLREISTAQKTILADYQKLKKENQTIVDERETLAQAFEILGNSRQVEAQARLLSRVSRIEDCLFGEACRRSNSTGSASESIPIPSDDTSRSRSISYEEGSVARKGGRRHPLSRSHSNDSMIPLSNDRRPRELKLSSMDAVHHGSATTLGSSRSTFFSASVNSFEDTTGSSTTLAFTPSPRRRIPVRVMSERWARSGSVPMVSPTERAPKSPSLHLSHHSFRPGDSNRSMKSSDIAEEGEDDASLDPNDVIVRDRAYSMSR
jgi:cell division protein FtsB